MMPKSMQLRIEDELLARRLEQLGLGRVRGVRRVVVHENRTVMVTLTRRGDLRIHRGYAFAPDRVLDAVIAFLDPRARRTAAARAQRELVAFPVEAYVRSRRPRGERHERPRPGDLRLMRQLQRLHRRFNRLHFGGRLKSIRFRISNRMRTRLGEVTMDPRTHRPMEIALGRRHIERDGWDEVAHTLLHEMVHQWQGENGLPVDHGASFRRKAVEVGIEPNAIRRVGERGKAARYG